MPTLSVNSVKPSAAQEPAHAMMWAGLVLAVVPMLVRASVNATTLPAWDLDPLLYPMAANSLTPMGSMVCDAVSLFGAVLLMLGAARAGVRAHVPTLLLMLIGAVAIVLHGWVLGPVHGTLGNQRVGSAWLSAMAVAAALWHAGQDARVRRVAVGVVFGFVVVLALLGAVQVLVTHAQTVADYKADPERMLAAHGWSAESPMAKAFVRRLMQPEATGWFGLSNVYATFAAAAAVGGLGLLWVSLRTSVRDGKAVLGSVMLSVAGVVGLWFAHSKGGFVAAGAGVGALGVLHVLSSKPRRWSERIGGVIGLLAIAGPIVLILVRGLIGERWGELSLLFRSYYVEAAAKIFSANPLAGVGPDGFQRAFTVAKPPLCPEEVSSPHGIVFDWTATLGVFGLAWVCLLGRWAWGAGASPMAAESRETGPIDRTSVRVLLVIPAAATVAAAFVETAMTTPEMALIRIGGLVLWCLAAWAIARAVTGGVGCRVALAGAAIAAIAHGQIDVAGSLAASAGLWAVMIVLAAAPAAVVDAAAQVSQTTRKASRTLSASAGLCLGLGLLVAFTAGGPVRIWESHLDRAADTVRPLAEFTERLQTSQRRDLPAGSLPESIDVIVRDLGAAVGRSVMPTADSVNDAMRELEGRLLPSAAKELDAAFDVEPSDRRTLREASRLHLRLAERAFGSGNAAAAKAEWERAFEVLRLSGPAAERAIAPGSSDWHWFASAHEHAAAATRDPAELRAAIKARLKIVPLDPYNLENARRIFRNAQKLGDQALAREWAGKCLELDGYMRLDRETRGLSDAERAEIAEAAK